MDQHAHHHVKPGHRSPNTDAPEDFPDGQPDEAASSDPDFAEYQARMERRRKHAAWRTEMALRLRVSGLGPSRPDSSF